MAERIQLKKSLSQNFLPDPGTLQRIVKAAQLGPEDRVLEIGPGSGHLTERLLAAAGSVIAVELDERLRPLLEERFGAAGNLKFVFGDALQLDLAALVEQPPVKIVANLPYHISGPLLLRLIEHAGLWSCAVLLLQLELVERICAASGRLAGSLSHLMRLHAEPCNAGKVKRTVFVPRPKVDSAILVLDFTRPAPCQPRDLARFQSVLRAAFGQRRKVLSNSLAGLASSRELLEAAFAVARVDPRARPEQLALEQFVALSDALDAVLKKG